MEQCVDWAAITSPSLYSRMPFLYCCARPHSVAKSLQIVTATMKLKHACSLEEKL